MSSQRSWQGLDLRGCRCSGCLLIFFVFLALPLSATTYYVDNCVTVGSDSNNGTSTSTPWLTIAHVNAQSFNPGDSVLFESTCTWREMLTVRSAGMSGNPITFGAYGSVAKPQILASVSENTAGAWTNESANIWYTAPPGTMGTDAYSSEGACAAWRDNVQLLLVSAKANLTSTAQCWWDSANIRLYVYATANPTSGPHTFELGQRDSAIQVSQSYVTFTSLFLGYNNNLGNANLWGSAASNVTVQNMTIAYGLGNGIRYYGTTYGNNWTITGNSVHDQWSHGISTGDPSHIDSWHIDHNTIANNAQKNDNNPAAGIYLIGDSTGAGNGVCTNNLIEYNLIYGSGLARGAAEGPTAYNVAGDGIWLDTCGQASQGGNTGNIIRYNLVHDNNVQGIRVEYTDGVAVYGNVIYNHTQQPANNVGIALDRHIHNNLIYNNTVYNSRWGIGVTGQWPTPPSNDVTSNLVKNNISYGNSRAQLLVNGGGQNNGTYGSGNVYIYNNLGAPTAQMIEWTFGNYLATYAALDAAYGSSTHSVSGDPKVTNARGGNFTLLPGSPDINAGANLGPSYWLGLSPASSWPSSVSTLNKGNGMGWDIGAFVFPIHIPPSPPTNLSLTVK